MRSKWGKRFKPMSAPFIICDNLVKIFRVSGRDVVALQGLDLVVAEGELIGVVGVSGSGKSTLMNILGGLDRPTAGRTWAGGKDLLKLSNAELDTYRLQQVGFVWQQTSRNLVSYLTAEQNISLPLTLAGIVGKEQHKRSAELLEQVGMTARKGHRLSEMSGGEQQRIGIAVALANRPKLLLADEPTGEVDANTALMIYELFRQLNQELNITTLIVSHDPELAHHVDRVVAIRDGKISSEMKSVQVPSTYTELDEAQLLAGASLDNNPVPVGESSPPAKQVQEQIVIDSAGRLQIPKEILEKYAIHNRVTLETLEEGVLVRPASSPGDHVGSSAESLIDQLEENRRQQHPVRRFVNALSKQLTGLTIRIKRPASGGNSDDKS